MSKPTPPFLEPSIANSTKDNRLTSDHIESFTQAIERLYIRNNLSARLKFIEEWPAAGAYIFDEALITFDQNGLKEEDDRERRKELEEKAEEKRLELTIKIKEFEEKSVDKGTLQIEYVKSLVKSLGRDLALHIYSPYIVDKFIPPKDIPLTDDKSEGEEKEKAAETIIPIDIDTGAPPLPPLPAPKVPKISREDHEDDFVEHLEDDPLAHIKPIDMSPPPSEPPTEPSTKSQETPPSDKEGADKKD